MNEREIRTRIVQLLDSQLLAVLATQRGEQPYANLIAFSPSPDLTTILFATPKPSRKYTNLQLNPHVSLLIDNRNNQESDFHEAVAVTVIGSCTELAKEDFPDKISRYLERHPYLTNFIQSPTTAVMEIAARHYIMVSRFQQVMELHLSDAMDLFSE